MDNNNNDDNRYSAPDIDVYSSPEVEYKYSETDSSSNKEDTSYDYNYDYSQPQGSSNNNTYNYGPTPNSSNNQPQSDNNSTAALVCGILSIVICSCYGFVGIALGIIAIVNANKFKANHGGKSNGANTAGMVTGIVGLCLSGITFISILFSDSIFSSIFWL